MISNPSYHSILGQTRPLAGVITEHVFFQTSPVFTESLGAFAKVYSIYCHNLDFQSGTQDLVSIWLVPSGETRGDQHCILNNYPVSNYENILKQEIVIASGAKIYIKSSKGISTFATFAEVFPFSYDETLLYNTIIGLMKKVANNTASAAEKEKLLYLTDGAYINNNVVVNVP